MEKTLEQLVAELEREDKIQSIKAKIMDLLKKENLSHAEADRILQMLRLEISASAKLGN